jgi:hypothetical protein
LDVQLQKSTSRVDSESSSQIKEVDSETSSISSPSNENVFTNKKVKRVEEGGMTALARCISVGSKPSLRDMVAGQEFGSLGVLACGPDAFVSEIRRAVVDNVASAKGVVDYYEEAYGW